MDPKVTLAEIERSLITTYRKHLRSKFIKAIKEYELISDGDRIAVAISGGKDSLLMAKLFQELYRHGNRNFELEFLAMDPGYRAENRQRLEAHLKFLEIPATIYDSDVFAVSEKIAGDNPCYMCARMRRGFLYAKAKELGCNKLALGHHFDDVIETILMNILFSGCFKTMMPKLQAENFENMELIRPMILIEEKYILRFTRNADLEPLNCACSVTAARTGNRRFEMKDLIAELSERYPNLRTNIFRSAENVNLNAILGYKDDSGSYFFTDNYER